jgi:hypothetical protein
MTVPGERMLPLHEDIINKINAVYRSKEGNAHVMLKNEMMLSCRGTKHFNKSFV